jgi:hypothetical protein
MPSSAASTSPWKEVVTPTMSLSSPLWSLAPRAWIIRAAVEPDPRPTTMPLRICSVAAAATACFI